MLSIKSRNKKTLVAGLLAISLALGFGVESASATTIGRTNPAALVAAISVPAEPGCVKRGLELLNPWATGDCSARDLYRKIYGLSNAGSVQAAYLSVYWKFTYVPAFKTSAKAWATNNGLLLDQTVSFIKSSNVGCYKKRLLGMIKSFASDEKMIAGASFYIDAAISLVPAGKIKTASEFTNWVIQQLIKDAKNSSKKAQKDFLNSLKDFGQMMKVTDELSVLPALCGVV